MTLSIFFNSCKKDNNVVELTEENDDTGNEDNVIFGDHFDNQPDWNTSQDGDLLTGWDFSQSGNFGGDFEAGYINSNGAHGGAGKGFTQYWDLRNPIGYAQDIWLTKNDINYPNEWYLGYWYQVDPSWDWGNADALKVKL